MSSTDFAVWTVAGDKEVPLPRPTTHFWRQILIDIDGTGATVWSNKAEVIWTFNALSEQLWQAIRSAIASNGSIKFRTKNNVGALTVCVGKTDQYPAEVRDRGKITDIKLTFTQVVPV